VVGAGSSRKLRAQPAWRAASSYEDARAFLQQRIAILSGVLFTALVSLLVFFALLYAVYPAIMPRLTPQIFGGEVVVALLIGLTWRAILTRRSLSFAALYSIDLAYAILVGGSFACAALFAPELRPAGYASLIQTVFAVFIRAIVVPSTGRRTSLISTATVLPLLGAAVGLVLTTEEDIPGPAYVVAAVVLCGVVVILATIGSRLIYSLRRKVSEATQLGQYTLGRKIGEGGMGTVYRGHHVLLRRPTAIKLMRPDRVGAEALERFEREVQHTSQLTHPNTVAVFDYGRSADGTFYYAMEYLDGIDLEQIVRRHGALPPGRTIEILVQVCGALAEAHERGIVHRDIKPPNIILCEHGGVPDVAKVVDFGLVKELAHDGTLTHEHILGTPAYVAPETITDPRSITHAADLYALGAVGYFLLAGKRVFDGASVIDLCIKHVTAEPASLAMVSPALDAVIMKCLRKRPEDRYASALELADALRAVPRDADWSEELAAAWWATQRATRDVNARAAAAQTITIDLEHRPS
jgi:serine/threonine-protein kinase